MRTHPDIQPAQILAEFAHAGLDLYAAPEASEVFHIHAAGHDDLACFLDGFSNSSQELSFGVADETIGVDYNDIVAIRT